MSSFSSPGGGGEGSALNFNSFAALFGGVALFLYGMSLLGGALESAARGRMGAMLRRLTGSRLRGVAVGAGVTAAVQSSSATTVIVVGLVDAGVITLEQATGVIMGANIGTTVTAHLLRLEGGGAGLLGLLSPAVLAPAAVTAGVALRLGSRGGRGQGAGQLLLGLGLLFTGMGQMETALAPLAALPAFRRLLSGMSDPLLGVLAGAGVTALIQSSSASVGILQAAASTGAVSWGAAVPVILGQNIGTCVTPLLASVGGSRGARQAALVHLLLNLLGAGVFLTAIYGGRRLVCLPFWGAAVDKGGIAAFHTFFNLAVTLLFLPFAGLVERAARRLAG